MFIVKNCIFPCTNKINYTMKESKVFYFFTFCYFIYVFLGNVKINLLVDSEMKTNQCELQPINMISPHFV